MREMWSAAVVLALATAGLTGASEPACSVGIQSQDGAVCCPDSCGDCGSAEIQCGTLPGGYDQCCTEGVLAQSRPCSQFEPPCSLDTAAVKALPEEEPVPAQSSSLAMVLSDPTADQATRRLGGGDKFCVTGALLDVAKESNAVCANAKCKIAGTAQCDEDPLGASQCCPRTIKDKNRTCDKYPPPCVMNPERFIITAPVKSIKRPTTIGILPGPSMSLQQREKTYGVQFDSILMYTDVQGLNFMKQVKPYLDQGMKVQMVVELGDTYANIIAGKYDYWMQKFGETAARDGREVTLRMLHEFNGSWYKWCVFTPGTDNNMQLFKQAYKYVVTFMRKTKGNFKFQLSYAMRNGETPDGGRYTTPAKDFYTGLAPYVDEVCVSAYNLCGANDYTGSNASLEQILAPWYNQVRTFAPDKNICVAEMGSTGKCKGKAKWITQAWSALETKFTKISTFNWFLEDKPQLGRDWDLSSRSEIEAFHNGFRQFKKATAAPNAKPQRSRRKRTERRAPRKKVQKKGRRKRRSGRRKKRGGRARNVTV
ncbi:glycoside hydrolase superfamily [Tribonema minus]|uniref:Glycoside hydrolase superfamily n=1 Tax=Tribonema minus TaxID=303371 RepID=A0A835YT65_9STRA|nr:glycoside hydrolase superfamily [Tribonema minus]